MEPISKWEVFETLCILPSRQHFKTAACIVLFDVFLFLHACSCVTVILCTFIVHCRVFLFPSTVTTCDCHLSTCVLLREPENFLVPLGGLFTPAKVCLCLVVMSDE